MKGRSGGVSRTERLNSEFQREICDVILRRLKNPLVTEMVSVTKVDVSPDLAHAKVFLSVFSVNAEKKQATFNALCGDAKRIRHELSKTMRIRTIPELHFILDDSMEYSAKISSLINKVGEKN